MFDKVALDPTDVPMDGSEDDAESPDGEEELKEESEEEKKEPDDNVIDLDAETVASSQEHVAHDKAVLFHSTNKELAKLLAAEDEDGALKDLEASSTLTATEQHMDLTPANYAAIKAKI